MSKAFFLIVVVKYSLSHDYGSFVDCSGHYSWLFDRFMVSSRYLLKRILFKIMVTLLIISVILYLVMGNIDINQFLKDAFITFISDKEVREKLQEAINSHVDATISHLVPWKNIKIWWGMKIGWISTRNK